MQTVIGGDAGHHRLAPPEAVPGLAALERHHGRRQKGRVPTAGQAGQAARRAGRDPHHRGLRTQGAPATGDGGMGHVARCGGCGQRRAQLMQMLAALQVDELGESEPGSLHGLGRRARNGEQERPVGLGNPSVALPVHHHGTDGAVGHHERNDGQRTETAWIEGRVDVGAIALQVRHGLGEEGDVVAQDGAVGLQGRQHAVRGLLGGVAEAPEGAQGAALVEEGKRRRVHAQFVAHGGEDGVSHLGRVGCRGQGPSHDLHALCRLGHDAPAPLGPGLGAGGPELHVALTA